MQIITNRAELETFIGSKSATAEVARRITKIYAFYLASTVEQTAIKSRDVANECESSRMAGITCAFAVDVESACGRAILYLMRQGCIAKIYLDQGQEIAAIVARSETQEPPF